MTYDDMPEMWSQIASTQFEPLKNRLLDLAFRYSRIRADWFLMTPEARREEDERRSRAHDAFISACNALSKNQLKAGEDNTWRVKLGHDRLVIGDFACYLHCYLGIRSR